MEEVPHHDISDAVFYPIAVWAFLATALVMYILLRFKWIAPYGRHVRKGWGPSMGVKEGWIVMEAPALFVTVFVYHYGKNHYAHVPHVLLRIFQMHYTHRALIYPFRMRSEGKAIPMIVIAAGIVFNSWNSYLQARWISNYGVYPDTWLSSPQFLLGATLFLLGFLSNIWADNVLLNLRDHSEDRSYKIPRGFLYEYITCPNYFSEVVEWLGWAIMTNSLAGFAFFLATLANLAPRAKANHEWYLKKFNDYPIQRKILIPLLY